LPEGRLEFADGPGEKVDLVVGADGVYSSVRESLRLVKSIVELRDGCGRHLIPRSPHDPVERTFETWSAGRRLGVAPASPESVYLFLCCSAGDIRARNQQPFDPEPWLESHPWYRHQIERIPHHPEGRWLAFYDVVCHAWSSGRVALVGDSAHAMSPNLGQGACVAMANGVALAGAVTRSEDIPAALRAWERRERPIVELAQRYSAYYGAVGTKWPQRAAMLDIRSHVVRKILLPLLDRRTHSITDEAVLRSLDAAIGSVSDNLERTP
jgi:2-polyprenyl-6-methoxyphenol hydroxylase-like FAD-dependent oxidoreductase